MATFSKEDLKKIKDLITPADIISLLEELQAEPKYLNEKTIVSRTICHDGDSKKLYYYLETQTFHCYTNCGTFDIFDLIKKVFNMEFFQSVYYTINKFNIPLNLFDIGQGETLSQLRKIENNYFRFKKQLLEKEKMFSVQNIELKEFDDIILTRFMYPIITPWEREGISRDVIKSAQIGYYPGGGQITIPHFDKNNRLIGIRGRQLGYEEAETFGKYRPLYINGILYNHPLGFNLYNLNNSKENIKNIQKVFVFEGKIFAPVHLSQLSLRVIFAMANGQLSREAKVVRKSKSEKI